MNILTISRENGNSISVIVGRHSLGLPDYSVECLSQSKNKNLITSWPTLSFSVRNVLRRVSWKTGISVTPFKLIYVLSISYQIPSLAPDVSERNHLYW